MVKFKDVIGLGKTWAAEYCKALNASKNYAAAAKGWGVAFEGAMQMTMTKSGEMEDDVSAFIDLKDGRCLGIKILNPGEEPPRKPILILTAPFYIWKKLALKELDPIQSLMAGRLKLDGQMNLAMRYAKAAMELANAVENTDKTLFTKWDLGEPK